MRGRFIEAAGALLTPKDGLLAPRHRREGSTASSYTTMAARHRRGSSASSCTTMRLMICLAAFTTASEMVKHKPKPMRTYTAVNKSEPARKRCGIQNVPHDPAQGTRVALALFGLVRNNATALNFERFLRGTTVRMIRRKNMAWIDVVLHANVASRITNARSGEALQKLPGYGAWRRFKRQRRWTLEDQGARWTPDSRNSSARS